MTDDLDAQARELEAACAMTGGECARHLGGVELRVCDVALAAWARRLVTESRAVPRTPDALTAAKNIIEVWLRVNDLRGAPPPITWAHLEDLAQSFAALLDTFSAESRAGALREAKVYLTTLEKLKYRLEHFPIGPDSARALLVVIDSVLGPVPAAEAEPGAQDRAGKGETR